MKSQIMVFEETIQETFEVAQVVESTWQDAVGEAFYAKTVDPLQEDSEMHLQQMRHLESELEQIGKEIAKL